jgi:uncharacterized DUF497 family protein
VISWDERKRGKTLAERGLDFADAAEVFAGLHLDLADTRKDYGEKRVITAGWLRGRFVVVVWTPRHTGRRVVSMRYGHADEEKHWRARIAKVAES